MIYAWKKLWFDIRHASLSHEQEGKGSESCYKTGFTGGTTLGINHPDCCEPC